MQNCRIDFRSNITKYRYKIYFIRFYNNVKPAKMES